MGTPLYFRPVRTRLQVAQVLTGFCHEWTSNGSDIDFGNTYYSNLWPEVDAIYDQMSMYDMSDQDIDAWFKKACRLGIKHNGRSISANGVRSFVSMWTRKGWTSKEQKKAGATRATFKVAKFGLFAVGALCGISLPMNS